MIIGLSGKMGSGKSTLANYIKDNSEQPTAVVKIAGVLYELQDMIYEELGLTLVGEKDRPLLIALGTWGRSIDENFWTSKALEIAIKMSNQGLIVIIDDIRYPNEAKAIEDAGGLLVRIEGLQRGPNINIEAMTNPTETALDDYPFAYRVSNLHGVEDTIKQFKEHLEYHKFIMNS